MLQNKSIKIKRIVLFLCVGMFFPIVVQAKNNDRLCADARKLVLKEDFTQAVSEYAKLIEDAHGNKSFLAEYAYVLALSGIYDGALMNVDRVFSFGGMITGEEYFYISQIFALMSRRDFSEEIAKKHTNSDIPQWIKPYYADFLEKYKQLPIVNQDTDFQIVFKRANYLGANAMYFQSIALFQEIITVLPQVYLPYIGYSTVLDKAGFSEKSAEALQRGIILMHENNETAEAKQAFNRRLSELKQKEEIVKPSYFERKYGYSAPQRMFYIGGMFAENMISFNGRYGIYYTDFSSLSADAGLLSSSGNTSFNIGLSTNFRWKCFAVGYGLNANLSENSSFGHKFLCGLTFVNKKGSASWDIFLNGYYPWAKNGIDNYGISIGRSIYFGERKKK